MKAVVPRLFLPLIASLCFAYSTAMAEESTVHIGSISILSGEGSSWGTAAKNGMTMAVEALNSKGGILAKKVEVDFQDDQGDPKKAISAFREIVDRSGARFIIGPTFSRSGLPLIDMADREKIIMISPSLGMAKFNESSKFLFNAWPHDYINAEKLAEYVHGKGHINVALIGAEEPWVKEQTSSFKRRFEELGGKIGLLLEPLPGTTDLRTEALKVAATPGIDAFVSTTDGVLVGALVAKALKLTALHVPMYSITMDQAAIDAAQGGFEGMEFLTFLTPDPRFKVDYEKRFAVPIDIGADSAFDSVIMLSEAISRANSFETTRVADELSKIKDYKGVSGLLISGA